MDLVTPRPEADSEVLWRERWIVAGWVWNGPMETFRLAEEERANFLGAEGDDEIHSGRIDILDRFGGVARNIDANLLQDFDRIGVHMAGTTSGALDADIREQGPGEAFGHLGAGAVGDTEEQDGQGNSSRRATLNLAFKVKPQEAHTTQGSHKLGCFMWVRAFPLRRPSRPESALPNAIRSGKWVRPIRNCSVYGAGSAMAPASNGEENMSNLRNPSIKPVEIDFLFIDLTTCTRCKGTETNIQRALETVATVLEGAGVDVRLRKILVDSEKMALELGFVSSPTIRVNGRDIAMELQESACASCGEACGCGEEIVCRDWIHEGESFTVAPVSLIVHAILSAVYGGQVLPEASKGGERPMTVPDNLKKFFAGKREKPLSACCDATEQESCCDPSEKSTCCGSAASGTTPAACGCR